MARHTRCRIHERSKLSRYCPSHKRILCYMCGEAHRRCGIISISRACEGFNISLEENLFSNSLATLLDYGRNIKRQINSQKAILNNLLREFESMGHSIDQDTEYLCQRLTMKMSMTSDILSDIYAIIRSMDPQKVSTVGKPQRQLSLCHHRKCVYDSTLAIERACIAVVETVVSIGVKIRPYRNSFRDKVEEFLENTQVIKKFTNLPNIQYPCGLSYRWNVFDYGILAIPTKLTPFVNFIVRINDDQKDCFISGLDIMPNGNILLADDNNFKIKLFSSDGQLLSYLTVQDVPTDVASINQTDAAVSVFSNQIIIVETDQTQQLSLKHIIQLQQFMWADRIAAYGNKLVFSYSLDQNESDAVQMIDLEGNVQWTVKTDSRDAEMSNLFNDIDFLTVGSGIYKDTLFILYFSQQTVTLISADSGEVKRVMDPPAERSSPFCATFDEQGNTYTCYHKGMICSWDIDNGETKCIIPDDKSLAYPFVIIFDTLKKRLILTSESGVDRECDLIHILPL